MKFSPLLLLFFLCSCSSNHLSVSMNYSTPSDIPSVQVGSPDPIKCHPPIGQELTSHWNVTKEYSCKELWSLVLHIRFRNLTEITLEIPIDRPQGHYTYSLLNEEYVRRGGIATYLIELFADGEKIDEHRHQLWSELILFE